jgi:hypothetical protein
MFACDAETSALPLAPVNSQTFTSGIKTSKTTMEDLN